MGKRRLLIQIKRDEAPVPHFGQSGAAVVQSAHVAKAVRNPLVNSHIPNSAAESLAAAALAFLRRYPLFDEMEDEALLFLASRLSCSVGRTGDRESTSPPRH